MTPGAHTELDPAVSSARAARDFVRQTLDVWDLEDPNEIVVLLTSEVVSNAVVHAATPLVLDLDLRDDVLRVAVRDRVELLPVVREPDVGALGGRGMRLVDRLARRWGSEPDADGGKVVWFELPVQRRQPGAAGDDGTGAR